MTKYLPIACLCLIAASLAGAVETPELINYQGVLRDSATGQPLDGSFDMLFRFFDADTGGNELLIDRHTAAQGGQVTVVNGLFNVGLGSGVLQDGSGPGTITSLFEVFRRNREVHLQIEVGIEVLSPRVRVGSSAYAINAARESEGPIDLHVNATTGDDANDGLSPGTPKATIMGAVRAIPAVLNGDVNIHVADGTYNEEVVLSNRTRNGRYIVRLIGNTSDPSQVTIQGTLAVDSIGVVSFDAEVELSGLTVDGFGTGVVAGSGGYAGLFNSVISANEVGVISTQGSFLEVHSTVFVDNLDVGVGASDNGTVELCAGGADPDCLGCVDFTNNGGPPIVTEHSSRVFFPVAQCCTFSGNGGGLEADFFSTIEGYGPCTSVPACSAGTNGDCRP